MGHIQRNVCVPLSTVTKHEELNVKLPKKCVHYLGHKIGRRPATLGVMLECQVLTSKEMVELFGQYSEVGYATVMCGIILNNQEPAVDPVRVPAVDQGAYDALYKKRAAL